jgi:8-oxo-dGTP pyrophosphatase MutT (NUDIX family)
MGYAFPMIAIPENGPILGSLAINAVESDLACPLPRAAASELDYLGRFGVSQSTGEQTLYEYWLFSVEPNQTLDLLATPTWNNNPPMFLTYDELTNRTDLTWSTVAIAREFVETQDAVLAVVTRAGENETEFLVVENKIYDGYFFPTQRVKSEVKPDRIALTTVRSDLGYRGPALVTWRGEVQDCHFSTRFHHDRLYRFHICDIQLPDVDLHQPGNVLEQALEQRGKRFRWLTGSQLADPAIQFSPTMAALRTTVLGLIPPRTFSGPLRRSEGGIALIHRVVDGQRQWLAQWNENWAAFFFIGGHREGPETFRDCVIREIEEELGLKPAECPVAATATGRLQYRALSRGAGQLTAYTMELYEAQPTPAGLATIGRDPHNKWLDAKEIRRLETHDGRPVSVSMEAILSQLRP